MAQHAPLWIYRWMYNSDQTQQRKGKAWSTGRLCCSHLTHKYQLLKMQLLKYCSTKEVSKQSISTAVQKGSTAAGKLQDALRKLQAENSQGSSHHSPHASWSGNRRQDWEQTCLILAILQLSNRLCYHRGSVLCKQTRKPCQQLSASQGTSVIWIKRLFVLYLNAFLSTQDKTAHWPFPCRQPIRKSIFLTFSVYWQKSPHMRWLILWKFSHPWAEGATAFHCPAWDRVTAVGVWRF